MIYQVVNNQGEHEYDLSIAKEGDVTKYALSYSNGNLWSEEYKGEQIMQIKDDGNNYYIHKHLKTDRGAIRYDEAAALFVILSYINSVDKLFEGKIGTFKSEVEL